MASVSANQLTKILHDETRPFQSIQVFIVQNRQVQIFVFILGDFEIFGLNVMVFIWIRCPGTGEVNGLFGVSDVSKSQGLTSEEVRHNQILETL